MENSIVIQGVDHNFPYNKFEPFRSYDTQNDDLFMLQMTAPPSSTCSNAGFQAIGWCTGLDVVEMKNQGTFSDGCQDLLGYQCISQLDLDEFNLCPSYDDLQDQSSGMASSSAVSTTARDFSYGNLGSASKKSSEIIPSHSLRSIVSCPAATYGNTARSRPWTAELPKPIILAADSTPPSPDQHGLHQAANIINMPDQHKVMLYRAAALQPVRLSSDGVPQAGDVGKPKPRRNSQVSRDPQSTAARQRRQRISEKMRVLQRLVPGGMKMDTASMLEEAAHYLRFLKAELERMEAMGEWMRVRATSSTQAGGRPCYMDAAVCSQSPPVYQLSPI